MQSCWSSNDNGARSRLVALAYFGTFNTRGFGIVVDEVEAAAANLFSPAGVEAGGSLEVSDRFAPAGDPPPPSPLL